MKDQEQELQEQQTDQKYHPACAGSPKQAHNQTVANALTPKTPGTTRTGETTGTTQTAGTVVPPDSFAAGLSAIFEADDALKASRTGNPEGPEFRALEQAYHIAVQSERLDKLSCRLEALCLQEPGFDGRRAFAFLRERREILLAPRIRHEYSCNASFEKLAAFSGLTSESGGEGFEEMLSCCRRIMGVSPLTPRCRSLILSFFDRDNAFCRERFLYLLGGKRPDTALVEHFLSGCGCACADGCMFPKKGAKLLCSWLHSNPGSLRQLVRKLAGTSFSLPEELQFIAGRAVLADAAGRVLPEFEHYLSLLEQERKCPGEQVHAVRPYSQQEYGPELWQEAGHESAAASGSGVHREPWQA